MNSLQELASKNFYHWQKRGSGYLLYSNPVEIEPPYKKFLPVSSAQEFLDDGRAPSLFSQVRNLIAPDNEKEFTQSEPSEIYPARQHRSKDRSAISVQFPNGTDIQTDIAQELLNLLCYSEGVFSFEICAQQGVIDIAFTASNSDMHRLESQIKGFFPSAIIRDKDVFDMDFNIEQSVAIADFGYEREFMLPLKTQTTFVRDPLTSIIATLGSIGENDTALFQILFKGLNNPWAGDMIEASSDGRGGSFFEDDLDFIKGVEQKVAHPLFAVVIRIASQGENDNASAYIAGELAKSISTISTSEYNRLIPLSNEGYDADEHLRNIYYRATHRTGCILNSAELAQFVHYPNKTIINDKIGLGNSKSKLQLNNSQSGIHIGENIHNGITYPVHLDLESRLAHTHIIGATGTGKSTLVANMVIEDISLGLGCAVFDPHGDLINDILQRIPENRKDDVIIIDPSDTGFPIGFNLLEAKTEAEKLVLSSDIVESVKNTSTAWGDNIQSVLANAVNSILESTKGGTLIDIKRFLIEEAFRNDFLTSIDDPAIHYFWNNEYPMLQKGIAPLLTRIDTFLRSKTVRYMLAQKSGVDISECLKENKIVLLKLSQGLIGQQNSYLLGSLFLAKFNQAALARQSQLRTERKHYMLYLDEFQNFITPSIEGIISGARKYALGIICVHQDLGQIKDSSLLNSILSNPKIRICFRLGYSDAKKLESGFSYFEMNDLQGLDRGEAIMRIGSRNNDFNLSTYLLKESELDFSEYIINNTRLNYARPKAEIEELLQSMLPKVSNKKSVPIQKYKTLIVKEPVSEKVIHKEDKPPNINISEEKRTTLVASENESREIRTHFYLQSTIKKLGQDRNFIATIEAPTKDGGRIDILLERDALKVGFEISETNKPAYELKNIKKCLKVGCIPVVMVSKNKKHLESIEKLAREKLSKKDIQLVKFLQPDAVPALLNLLMQSPKSSEEIIKGFRVVTEFEKPENSNLNAIKSKLGRLFKPKK